MNIGKNIKKQRNIKNITQSELAKNINRSLRMVQKYESNEVIPSLEIIEKIATALNLSKWNLIKSSEEIYEDVNNFKESFKSGDYTTYSLLNINDMLFAFRSILITLGYSEVLNISDKILTEVLLNQEFKNHSIDLINKYHKENEDKKL